MTSFPDVGTLRKRRETLRKANLLQASSTLEKVVVVVVVVVVVAVVSLHIIFCMSMCYVVSSFDAIVFSVF